MCVRGGDVACERCPVCTVRLPWERVPKHARALQGYPGRGCKGKRACLKGALQKCAQAPSESAHGMHAAHMCSQGAP